MKKENLFTEIDPELRAEMLAQRSYKTDFESIRRPYSEETKAETKDFVVNEATQIMEQSAQMKRILKEFQDAIKKNKSALQDALVTLKRGYSDNEEKVFYIDDQDAGMMDVYDSFGEFQYSRKLRPEEKQTRVLSIATGTEG